MSERTRQTGMSRRQLWAGVQAWSFALLTTFLLAVPTLRTNELQEVEISKETVESVACTARSSSKRIFQPLRREAIVFTSSIQARLARQHDVEPSRVDGHRLPNGLLAPMTC
jgi:hypothetical protein